MRWVCTWTLLTCSFVRHPRDCGVLPGLGRALATAVFRVGKAGGFFASFLLLTNRLLLSIFSAVCGYIHAHYNCKRRL